MSEEADPRERIIPTIVWVMTRVFIDSRSVTRHLHGVISEKLQKFYRKIEK